MPKNTHYKPEIEKDLGSISYVYDFVLITYLIFSLYWVFVGKVLEMENVATFRHSDVGTSQRSNVVGKTLTNLIS